MPLFDGRTFAGWEGETNRVWRIEDGAIVAGAFEKAAPRNEFLTTTRQFTNFQLRLRFRIQGSEALNAGIQFRTQRIPNHHEVSGYQADIGPGVDGHLYDESRRNRMLAAPSPATVARALRGVGTDGWHEYRISAINQRILLWLNGVQTVEFMESDPAIPRGGVLALQIHGGMKGTIAYRDIEIEELPSDPAAVRFGVAIGTKPPIAPFPGRHFGLETNDVVVFVGQTDIVRLRDNVALEAALATQFATARPKFRNMAWEGDTVYEQWRDLNFGTWAEQLAAAGATVVIAQFGQLEALDGTSRLDEFTAAYEALLDQFAARTRRVVLLSPRPFERPLSPHMPDHAPKNPGARMYTEAVSRLAARRDCVFVDLFAPLQGSPGSLTVNGMHLTPEGHMRVAELIAAALGARTVPPLILEALTRALREKNRLWFDNWRPANWSFAYGDRTEQPFGKAGGGRPPLRIELEEFQPLIAAAESEIHRLSLVAHEGRIPDRGTVPVATVRPTPMPPDAADHSPEAELRSFTAAEGFSVNLFASEADGVVKPLQMRWDDAGQLWVLCAPTYPHLDPGARPGDYILVCRDTDGDGRADRFSKFAQGLFIPMGIEFGAGGVYLAEGSELVHLRDTDGDGRADAREVVLSGFGTADTHQMINGLELGPGGELWFTQGHHVYSRVETPWGLARLDKAGVWRYRPRTGRLDGFFNLSTAGLNCQGVTHDDWGQTFHNSGALSGGFYTTPGSIPTLKPRTYWAMAVPDRRNTGIEIVGTRHLPAAWQGCVVWSGFMGNTVQLHRLEDEGSGFTAVVLPDLVKSSRREFRPVNVRVGPDGAIYVCDWYNPIIGHYQASYRDPARDKTRGRIWRVAANDRPVLRPPSLDGLQVSALLELLRTPERLTRHNAKRRLFDRPTADVIPKMDAWVAGLPALDPDREQLLLHALGIYEAHETVRPALLGRLLQARDFRVRAYATRVLGHWAGRLPDVLALLERQVADAHPRVRLEAIVASSYLTSPAAIVVALRALDLPRDRFIDYALAQAVDALRAFWHPALSEGWLAVGAKPEHLRFLLEADGGKEAAALLRQLGARADIDSGLRESALGLLARVGSAGDLRFALDFATTAGSEPVLLELAATARIHHRQPEGDLLASVRALMASANHRVRARGLDLAGAWTLTELAPAVRTLLSGNSDPEEVTRAAIGAAPALLGNQAVVLVRPFADAARSLELRGAAIAALAALDLGAASHALAAALGRVQDETEARELMTPLLNRQGGGVALAEAFRAQSLATDTAKLARRALNATGRNDAALVAALNAAIGVEQSAPAYNAAFVRALAEEAKAHGNATRGRQVYSSALASCSTCHKLEGQGGETGPDLSLVGAGRSVELLVESLLWPNRQVREGYLATTVTTRDDEQFTGYKSHESADEIRLRDPASDRIQRIAKADVASMRDTGSLMPEGLATGLTRDELRDLIRFLSELGRAGDGGR
jgi:putative heme-binding domain-containing protein